MRLKKFVQLFAAGILAVSMAACAPKDNGGSGNQAASNGPIVIVDREGIVTVLEQAPTRVVSISPAITEAVAALAGIEALVGRTTYCDYPEGIAAVEEIGDLYSPNVEAVIALEPDVVLLSAHTNPDVAEAMRSAGLKVIRIYDEYEFEGGYKTVEAVGKILGMDGKAADMVADMKATVAATAAKIKDLPVKTVYYMSSAGEYGDYAATGDTYVGAMLEHAGGINVAKDGVAWAFSLEALLEADPEVIITSTMSGYKALLPEMEGYKDLTAVKEGRVMEIDTNPIDRIGVRFAEGFELLAQSIHPEAFE